MRVDRVELRKKRSDQSEKKQPVKERKRLGSNAALKASSWYQGAAQKLAIPLDRREQRDDVTSLLDVGHR